MVEIFVGTPDSPGRESVFAELDNFVEKKKRRAVRDEVSDRWNHEERNRSARNSTNPERTFRVIAGVSWAGLNLAGCRLAGLKQHLVDFVGGDDAVIDGAEPAGHDDADGTGVVEARQLFREVHGDLEAFELGAK